MNLPLKLTDSGQWIAELSHRSSTVARVSQGSPLPLVAYTDAHGQIAEPDPYHFANDADHNDAFVRCFDGLSANGASDDTLRKYLGTLTNGNKTYGTVSELLTYLWLLDHHTMFEIQIPMTGADILNPNGSDLDGKVTFSSEVFFDIKGFGFQETAVKLLTDRLEADIPGQWIAAQGSWDVSAETLEDLLSKGYARTVGCPVCDERPLFHNSLVSKSNKDQYNPEHAKDRPRRPYTDYCRVNYCARNTSTDPAQKAVNPALRAISDRKVPANSNLYRLAKRCMSPP